MKEGFDMDIICIVSAMAMIFGMCMFVRSFKLLDNKLEDLEESSYVRKEAINKCLVYGNVMALSVGLLIARLIFTYLI